MNERLEVLAGLTFSGREGARVTFTRPGGRQRLVLTVVEEDVLRVQVQPLGHATVPKTWAVVGSAGDAPAQGRDREDLSVFSCPPFTLHTAAGSAPQPLADNAEPLTLATSRFHATFDPRSAALSVALPDGTPLLRDHADLAYRFTRDGSRGIRHTLQRDRQELYLGLGEVSGPLDRHHRRYRLDPRDALGYDARDSDPLYKHLPVQLTLTPAGHAWGLLYDSGANAVFDMGSEVDNYLGFYRYAQFAARELDYYILVGPELPRVVRRINDLSGYPPVPPEWTLGYLGSTMRYTDAPDPTAELAGFVDELARHGLQCSAFHLSSGYSMGDDGLRYVFRWNRRRIPDSAAMLAPLREAGIRTIANIKPALLTSHPAYTELARAGAFVLQAQSDEPYTSPFWGGPGSYLDFTNPLAYDWWKEQVKEHILRQGIDATWNDNNEFQIDDPEARTAAGRVGDLRPVLTLLMNRASLEAQLEHARETGADEGDAGFLLTRSGSLGTQRYAQTWSGDNYTSWRTLRYNIAMGLGLALSGWSNHGHDVGGFAGPAPDEELLVRWIEAGIFMPRFCIHSWNDDGSATEPWTHPGSIDLIRGLFDLRETLRPYLLTLFEEAASEGKPVTRPFVYEFQEWREGWRESFAYLLGDALLVAPVLEPGAEYREVLLPPGGWLDWWSGARTEGGVRVSLAATLGRPVLLVREGFEARVPHGPWTRERG